MNLRKDHYRSVGRPPQGASATTQTRRGGGPQGGGGLGRRGGEVSLSLPATGPPAGRRPQPRRGASRVGPRGVASPKRNLVRGCPTRPPRPSGAPHPPERYRSSLPGTQLSSPLRGEAGGFKVSRLFPAAGGKTERPGPSGGRKKDQLFFPSPTSIPPSVCEDPWPERNCPAGQEKKKL